MHIACPNQQSCRSCHWHQSCYQHPSLLKPQNLSNHPPWALTMGEGPGGASGPAQPAQPGVSEASAAAKPWTGRGQGRRHMFGLMARGRDLFLSERGGSSHAAPLESPGLRLTQGEGGDSSEEELLRVEPWVHVSPERVAQIGAAAARARMATARPSVITWPWRDPRTVRWGFGGVPALFRVHWREPALEGAREPPLRVGPEVARVVSEGPREPPRQEGRWGFGDVLAGLRVHQQEPAPEGVQEPSSQGGGTGGGTR